MIKNTIFTLNKVEMCYSYGSLSLVIKWGLVLQS
jgi:hypothetical protein